MADVNPEPRAIDEQMDRLVRGEPTKSKVIELLQSPRQSRVVGDREIDLEELSQATEKALGLAKRKMEDHADRQSRLDRDVCVGTLAAGFATGRSSPGIERVIRQPDGQVAAPPEAGLVLSPIPHPIRRLRMLVLASLRILHRCSLQGQGFRITMNLQSGAMHQGPWSLPPTPPSIDIVYHIRYIVL